MQYRHIIFLVRTGIFLLLMQHVALPAMAQYQRTYDSVLTTWGNLSSQFNQADIMLPVVSVKPSFPGGHAAWVAFIKQHFNKKIPFANQIRPGNYRVVIRFTVGRDSVLRNIGAETNVGFGLESEMIRCFKAGPLWHPARSVTDEQVSFTMRQMVTFIVKSNDVELIIPEQNNIQ